MHLFLPLPRQVGLGELVKQALRALGVRPCGRCARRAARLDSLLTFGPRAGSRGDCWRFHGSCTGFGSTQCVVGPEEQTPDARIITQCCGGWFQYPWIEVCPGQKATRGCGFCFW
jgi:hypothetical protein